MTQQESLIKHRDFLKLWTAETISVFGSQFSGLAIPLTAAVLLNATPTEMGILSALATAPFLLFGLIVGVWVDRLRRRKIMMLSNLGRAILLATIPTVYLLGRLNMNALYLVAFLTGVLTVFFDVAYQAYLPSLVERTQLVEANSKLETSRSSAQVIGPGIAGVLVQFLSAPLTIALDAIGYLGSATLLKLIKKREADPQQTNRKSLMQLGTLQVQRTINDHEKGKIHLTRFFQTTLLEP